jgi:hypothetical protein
MARSAPPARLATLIALPRSERALAVRAVGVLLGVRAALALLSFVRVRALIDRLTHRPDAVADEGAARAVRRAVDRAARTVPGSACLSQALTAELLLRRAGCEARVSIGVAPDGAPLAAHAWVESAGVLVTGDADDLGRYRTLLVYDAAPQRRTSDA